MRIKFFILICSKHFKTGVNKKLRRIKATTIQYRSTAATPTVIKPILKIIAIINPYQKHTRIIFSSLTPKRIKNKNENKNIIDAQAPFHQVCADIFKRRLLPFPVSTRKPKNARASDTTKKSLLQRSLNCNNFYFAYSINPNQTQAQ
jgi:hypothetical protein